MGQEADHRWGALAGAAALAAALTALARPLLLAAALWTAGPLPALQTALWWTSGQSEVLQTAASTETIPLPGRKPNPRRQPPLLPPGRTSRRILWSCKGSRTALPTLPR